MIKKALFFRVAILLFAFIHFGCFEKERKATTDVIKQESTNELDKKVAKITSDDSIDKSKIKSIKTDYDCPTCVHLLEEIVGKSDFDNTFKKAYNSKYSIVVNEATTKKVSIQIVLLNEDNSTVPMGWLELDLEKEKLVDVTSDPEEPVDIKFDNNLLDEFKINCTQCCLD